MRLLVLFIFLGILLIYGCIGGVPPVRESVSCEDTDGDSLSTKGTVTIKFNDGTTKIEADSCPYPEQVREHTCEGNSPKVKNGFCPSGKCQNGACLESQNASPKADQGKDEGIETTPVSCNDSDGDDLFIKGVVTLTNGDGTTQAKEDYCANSDQVVEYICGDEKIKTSGGLCPAGKKCNDGACQQ